MGGLYAVVNWPPGGPSEARAAATARTPDDGEILTRILANRPQAPWEKVERVSVPGAACAVIWPAGPASEAPGAEDLASVDLGRRGAALSAEGPRVAAVIATDGAEVLARRLLAAEQHPSAPEESLLPFPHAALAWDGSRLDLHLDPLGAWPLYLRRLPGRIAVGTAALPLARLAPSCDLDPEGVAELLAFGQLLGSRTLYGGVEAMPAGARFRMTAEATSAGRTAIGGALAVSRDIGSSLDVAADDILAALEEAARIAALAPRAGLLLSGGLDSRLLLAVLHRQRQPVSAFTFGQPGCADERLARRVASILQVPHRVAAWSPAALARVLDHAVALTDGHVSALHFHGTDLVAAMRESASVQWNGFAGDAILGGSFVHPRYSLPGPPSLEARLFAALNKTLRPEELGMVLAAGVAADLRGHARGALAAALARVPEGPAPERARQFLLDQRVGRLAALGLALDRHYLPVVTPYAHGPVLAAMTRLGLGERRYGRALCRVLVRHFPELATIPWQRTGARPGAPWPWAAAVRAGGRLWARAGFGRGAAIADYPAWLDGPLKDLRGALLRSPSLRDRPLFDPNGLDRLAAGRVQTARAAALAGVLMAIAVAAEILDGKRRMVDEIEIEPDPAP